MEQPAGSSVVVSGSVINSDGTNIDVSPGPTIPKVTDVSKPVVDVLKPKRKLRKQAAPVTDDSDDLPVVPFNELQLGSECRVKAFVFHKWEVIKPDKNYLSTNFLLVDHTGGGIHCTARASIAHCFASKMVVSQSVFLSGFTVKPNRAEYRLRRSDPFIK